MKNSIGGKLQGIGLDAFLQMAQMEQSTCTLSVTSGDRTGQLFLLDGKLISAEMDDYSELEAAHQIISWEKTVIDITESCSRTIDEIKQPLMNILMEAMRLRDDAKSNPAPKTQPSEKPGGNTSPPAPEKTAASETALPETSNDDAQKQSINPETQPDPDTKAVQNAEKKPVATKAGTASKSKGPSKRLPWKPLIAGVVILLAAGGLITYFLSIAKQNRLAYEAFVLSVKEAGTPEQKLGLLNSYIRKNPDSTHSKEVTQQIKTLMKENDERVFNAIEQTASRLAADGALEEATRVYEKYLKENKESQYTKNASTALKRLSTRKENRAFKEMQAAAATLGSERMSLYRSFLDQYPDGNHRRDVLSFISDMEDEFFIYVEHKVQEYELERNWAACIELGQQYLDLYPESGHAEAVTKWLVRHREEYQASQSFEQLRKRADRYGTDHEAALAVFSDYLKAYPGTPVRGKIEREIDRFYALSEQKRLADATTRMVQKILSAGSRFSVENNETVLDTKSGLMWSLLDSRVTENRCLTYEEATAHVSSLETGGYDDWRLPNPKELSALYGKAPSFPFDTDTWYWSSKTENRYISQRIVAVEVIDPNKLDGKDALMKESWECGTVMAVRRTK